MAKRKKLYLVLDTETATVPQVLNVDLTAKQKQKISCTKPIIYDLGYKIIDRQGTVYKTVSYIIADCYYDRRLFETAYYKNKRPLYEAAIKSGEMKVKTWAEALSELWQDIERVDFVAAYNATFDFKHALPFTISYFANCNCKWFNQKIDQFIENIRMERKIGKNPTYSIPYLDLPNGKICPIVDIMPLAVDRILGKRYPKFAYDNGLITDSGKHFKTSAEAVYRYMTKNETFVESHTALADVNIEAEMLLKCLKKGKPKVELGFFCYRMLPSVADYENQIGIGGDNNDNRT